MSIHDIFSLEGKIAIVTGAGIGLGRLFSRTLADAGAYVLCTDIHETNVVETARLITDNGGSASVARLDVTQEGEVAKVMAAIVEEHGRLDIAINNAGVSERILPAHEIPLDEWDRVIDINLRGVFLCAREEVRPMMRQRSGKIINLASILGLVGAGYPEYPRPAYAPSKGAIVNLTRELAVEYAPYHINVNAIAPGYHAGTQLGQGHGGSHPNFHEDQRKLIPFGRMSTPEGLRGTILYLASSASDYVTGHTLVVDGGYVAR